MDVKLVDRGNEGELILSGKLDATSAAAAEELFLKMADRFTDLTLNMRDLKYISSAGLRVLKKLYLKVNKNGGELSVSNVSAYVNEVFEMVGFASILNFK
ncbi:STAS domain-containing protein [Pseudobutyrivibrio sp.]|jgi:anti-sigma B factor antagonist|uniref:STAS domain-containing protein n=1 Tax=Pseudobutyrivibrio sp. TaxID=2014367 RepID=UPI001E04A25B|nr:STAS domain-containing protein [Pseudobutyrivibrio sp.]MBE5910457.1 STAS domain-containing protein [Pseudobutyrivibrio sp.]